MAKESKKAAAGGATRVEKKERKKKDGPKRGLSAYMFFSQANREKIKTEHPQATFGEIGKYLGAEWKTLSDAEKKPYEKLAMKDKERYEAEKAKM